MYKCIYHKFRPGVAVSMHNFIIVATWNTPETENPVKSSCSRLS